MTWRRKHRKLSGTSEIWKKEIRNEKFANRGTWANRKISCKSKSTQRKNFDWNSNRKNEGQKASRSAKNGNSFSDAQNGNFGITTDRTKSGSDTEIFFLTELFGVFFSLVFCFVTDLRPMNSLSRFAMSSCQIKFIFITQFSVTVSQAFS